MRPTMFGVMIMTAALCGCTQDPAPTEEESEPSRAEKLASFKMSNGNQLSITGLADGEVVVMETTPAGGGERFVVDDFPGASPLELFARLTPEGTAVPEGIATSATAEDRAAWMRERPIARDVIAPGFDFDVADLGWKPIASATPGLGSCNPTTGADYFEDNHCDQLGPYGYGASWEACDEGKAFNYWQHSPDNMRHTYTRTAACDGTGWIRHSRYYSGSWHTVLDETIEPNTVATYYSYTTGTVKQPRRARAEPRDPYDTNAYVRLWAKFFDQVDGNAP